LSNFDVGNFNFGDGPYVIHQIDYCEQALISYLGVTDV